MNALEQRIGLGMITWAGDGRGVVQLTGELDVYSCGRLRDALAGLSAFGYHRVALDISGLEFCDSSGLGVLVGAVNRARTSGGGLALVGVRECILRTLRITGLTKVIPVFTDLAEALAHLDAR